MAKKTKIDTAEEIGKQIAARNTELTCDVCGATGFKNKGILAIHKKGKKCVPTIVAETVEEPIPEKAHVSKETKKALPFKCWVPGCDFRSKTEDELKTHYEKIHPEVELKPTKGGGFQPIIGKVRVTKSHEGKKPKAPKKEKVVKPSVPAKAGRKDRGDWYNARTGMQLWLLNDSKELEFLEGEVAVEDSGGRPGVLLKALRFYMEAQK